jgi:hypothetical protein
VRVLAAAWSLVWGLVVFLPLMALAWAYRHRLRWPLTGIFLLYIVAMIVLLVLKR